MEAHDGNWCNGFPLHVHALPMAGRARGQPVGAVLDAPTVRSGGIGLTGLHGDKGRRARRVGLADRALPDPLHLIMMGFARDRTVQAGELRATTCAFDLSFGDDTCLALAASC